MQISSRRLPPQPRTCDWPGACGFPAARYGPGVKTASLIRNLVIATGQKLTATAQQLDFWWGGPTFGVFNSEVVTTTALPTQYFSPMFLSNANSSGEVAIFAPFTTNGGSTYGLADWTKPVGGSAWTPHTVVAP
jgi:hypothetical protein